MVHTRRFHRSLLRQGPLDRVEVECVVVKVGYWLPGLNDHVEAVAQCPGVAAPRLHQLEALALPLPEADQLAPAVEESLDALKLGERDAAAAQLARRYAVAIDQAADPAYVLRHLGPLLLRALGELQATPAARPTAKPERSRPNRVAQLRAAHANSPAKRKRTGALWEIASGWH